MPDENDGMMGNVLYEHDGCQMKTMCFVLF